MQHYVRTYPAARAAAIFIDVMADF